MRSCGQQGNEPPGLSTRYVLHAISNKKLVSRGALIEDSRSQNVTKNVTQCDVGRRETISIIQDSGILTSYRINTAHRPSDIYIAQINDMGAFYLVTLSKGASQGDFTSLALVD